MVRYTTTILLAVVLAGCTAGPDEKEQVSTEFKERFTTVAKSLSETGMSVEKMDPEYPYTMRVHVPSKFAMEMTPTQAKEIAGLTRTKLGEKAIVYIKSDGGQTLAKATRWGIE